MAAHPVWKILLASILLNFLAITMTAAQSLAGGFLPAPNGAISALLVQPDGKILAGGAFTTIAGQPRQRLARLDVDGNIEQSFAPVAVDNSVVTIALQPDG